MFNPWVKEDVSPIPFKKSPTILISKKNLEIDESHYGEQNRHVDQSHQEETKVGIFLYDFDKGFNYRYYFPENNLSFLLEKIASKTQIQQKTKRKKLYSNQNRRNALSTIKKKIEI